MANGNCIMHSNKSLSLAATMLALTLAPARAQTELDWYHAPVLVPADTDGGGDTAADEKAAEAELVKKTLNPVASLVSVPIQNNWDFGIGSANAMRYTANIQPVIP